MIKPDMKNDFDSNKAKSKNNVYNVGIQLSILFQWKGKRIK